MRCTSSRARGALLACLIGVGTWMIPQDARAEENPRKKADVEDIDDGAPALAVAYEPEAQIGLGVRLRRVHLPTPLLELFLTPIGPSGGGAAHTGIGAELIRQKGSFVFSLGVEYENISVQDGLYVDRGQTIPETDPDYLHFNDFRWLGVDITFTWQHGLIGDFLSLRYGAGLGVGYIMGTVERTDYRCTSSDVNSCSRDPEGMNNSTPEEAIPPVFPIVNVIVGAQLRPIHNLAINIEGGIRTLPFFGTTVALMF
jgi:hypothetical protein